MPYNPDDLMVQCEGCKDCYDTSVLNMENLTGFCCTIGHTFIHSISVKYDNMLCWLEDLR